MNQYNIYLEKKHINALNDLRESIKRKNNLNQYIEACQVASTKIKDREFPYVYAGILLAKKGQLNESLKLLNHVSENHSFCSHLQTYLEEYNSFHVTTPTFQETKAFDVWLNSQFYQNYQASIMECISDFASRENPGQDQITIIDIGTGNGILITKIVNLITSILNFKKINLVLIDQSLEMLKSAKQYCKRHCLIPVEIVDICSKIQDLNFNDKSLCEFFNSSWFVLASASLHHMSRKFKKEILQNILEYSPRIFISEFHANHDLPEEDTPEFIYSVTQHYRYYIDDIMSSLINENEKKICIQKFILSEAITMLKNPKESRVDYHAPLEEWISLSHEVNGIIKKQKPTISLSKERMLTFFLEIHSKKRESYV